MDLIKKLSSVKFAVFIFLYIVALCVIATLLPQNQAAEYYSHNYGGVLSKIILLMQFDRVFNSLLFAIGFVLLSINLLICTYQRLRWAFANQKKNPRPRLELKGDFQTEHIAGTMPEAEAHIKNVFNGYHWTMQKEESQITAWAGAKGKAQYWGSPILHLGLCLVLVGSIISLLSSQKEFKYIAVGDTAEIKSGPAPYSLKVEDFKIEYYDDGVTPKQYISFLTAITEDSQKSITTSVNHPAEIHKTKIVQASYGLHFKLMISDDQGRQKELSVMNGDTLSLDEGGHLLISFRMDAASKMEGQNSTDQVEGHRLLVMVRHNNEPVAAESLLLNEKKQIITGLYLQFMNSGYSTGLQIKYDPGINIIFAGFLIVILGMIIRFLISNPTVYVVFSSDQEGVVIRWQKTSTI